MPLLLVSVSHRTAPVELRERLDFVAAGIDRALAALSALDGVDEAVVLSTCNRAEVYVATARPELVEPAVRGFIAAFHGVPGAEVDPHVRMARDEQAAHHLFRVAAGLDSLVVGEPQILGQLKTAFSSAAASQYTGPILNRAFHAAFAAGKRVRSETGVGEGAVSIGYAAVGLARKIFGRLEGRDVLVVGGGEMGRLTARHLQANGARVTLTSRTLATAQSVARELGAAVRPWDDLPAALSQTDIVVSATGAAEPVITRSLVEQAIRARRHRPIFLIDIAVPRDVEPAVAGLEEVFLYDIDDLESIVRDNLEKRAGEIARAEAMVQEAVGEFASWLRSRGAIPTVVALRQRFEAIRRAELERLDGKLTGLPPDARARVDDVTRLLVEKLLLAPTEQLKTLGDPEKVAMYSDVLTRLFNLDERRQAARTADSPDTITQGDLPHTDAPHRRGPA